MLDSYESVRLRLEERDMEGEYAVDDRELGGEVSDSD